MGHGLWLHTPDYRLRCAKQLLKPIERNTNYLVENEKDYQQHPRALGYSILCVSDVEDVTRRGITKAIQLRQYKPYESSMPLNTDISLQYTSTIHTLPYNIMHWIQLHNTHQSRDMNVI